MPAGLLTKILRLNKNEKNLGNSHRETFLIDCFGAVYAEVSLLKQLAYGRIKLPDIDAFGIKLFLEPHNAVSVKALGITGASTAVPAVLS